MSCLGGGKTQVETVFVISHYICPVLLAFAGNVSRHRFPFTNKVGQLYMIYIKCMSTGTLLILLPQWQRGNCVFFVGIRHAKQLAYESIEFHNIQPFKGRTQMKDQPIGQEDKLETNVRLPQFSIGGLDATTFAIIRCAVDSPAVVGPA